MTKHVVQFSGGLGSFWSAFRVIEKYGPDNVILLFADTLIEDADLYRFLADACRFFGLPLVRVADGRTPLEVFRDVRFLGNSRVAPCSKYLKQLPCRQWLRENCDPDETTIYVGIDRTEAQRVPQIVRGWSPWTTSFPVAKRPHWTKDRMIRECARLGIEPPRLYKLGFKHNNCAAMCVRAGQRHWLHLLKVFPDRYAYMERAEAELRKELGDVTILRRQVNGVRQNYSLSQHRAEAS
jgi:3'-phosphoadenosine 5'-phosphosulfate sulfotransferase (PAPS reductase)/FAD synthetase